MARIRTIKPEFWDDLKLAKISRDARLLYIGTWNFADDAGVIIADHLWLKSKVFPFDQIQVQQFDKWMQELVKSGFISLFSHNREEFYYLPNLTRHQRIDRPNYQNLNVPKSALDAVVGGIRRTFDEQSQNNPDSRVKDRSSRGVVEEESINPHTTSDEVVSPPTGGRTFSKSDFSKRKEKFKAEVGKYLETYGRELLNAFFAYWTEPNKSATKMKFELERTWDLSRRLARWAANDKGFADKSGSGKWMSYNEASKYWSAADPQDNWICDPQTKLWRRK